MPWLDRIACPRLGEQMLPRHQKSAVEDPPDGRCARKDLRVDNAVIHLQRRHGLSKSGAQALVDAANDDDAGGAEERVEDKDADEDREVGASAAAGAAAASAPAPAPPPAPAPAPRSSSSSSSFSSSSSSSSS